MTIVQAYYAGVVCGAGVAFLVMGLLWLQDVHDQVQP